LPAAGAAVAYGCHEDTLAGENDALISSRVTAGTPRRGTEPAVSGSNPYTRLARGETIIWTMHNRPPHTPGTSPERATTRKKASARDSTRQLWPHDSHDLRPIPVLDYEKDAWTAAERADRLNEIASHVDEQAFQAYRRSAWYGRNGYYIGTGL